MGSKIQESSDLMVSLCGCQCGTHRYAGLTVQVKSALKLAGLNSCFVVLKMTIKNLLPFVKFIKEFKN